MNHGSLTPNELEAVAIAEETLVFVAGAEDAGANPELIRRARLVAGAVLELAEALKCERSARAAIQASRDRALKVLEKQAGAATAGATAAELASTAAAAVLAELDAEFGTPDDDFGEEAA